MNLEGRGRARVSVTRDRSIGPTTPKLLEEYGLTPDLEPSHPKLGHPGEGGSGTGGSDPMAEKEVKTDDRQEEHLGNRWRVQLRWGSFCRVPYSRVI